MKRLTNTILQLVVLVGLGLFPAASQAEKPVAVVSITALNDLFDSLAYITEAAGADQIGRMAIMMAKPYTQGLDSDRPIGVVVTAEGMEFKPLGFVPVKDLKLTLDQLKDQIGEPRDAGGGVMEIPGAQPVFVKERDGWAYIGQTVEALADIPQDCVKMLGGLNEDYDIAVRTFVQNVPQAYRDMAISQLKEGLKQGLEEAGEDTAELQEKVAKNQIEQLTRLINETDQMTVGWKIDSEKQKTFFDMTMIALPGSRMAGQMQRMADARSSFGGFMIPDAAISGGFTSVMDKEDIEQTVQMLDGVRQKAVSEIDEDDDLDGAARDASKKVLDSVFGIVTETLRTGNLDSATAVILKPRAMTLVSGSAVADGSKVEAAVKDLIELSNNEPELSFSNVKLNAGKIGNVRLHTMSIPIPEEEYVRQVLGEQLDVVIGVEKQKAYLALGSDGMTHLKEALAGSKSPVKTLPFQANLALTPIVEFVSSIEENPVVTAIAEGLAEADGRDHIRITTQAIKNGFTSRLELEEGVLRAIGSGATMATGGGF